MAELADTYLVHNADCTCNLGLRPSKVVLEESHGVYLKGMAMINEEDHIGGTNILDFCGCHSATNPETIKTAHEIAEAVKNDIGRDFRDEVEAIFCNGTNGGAKVMKCAGKCTPYFVSENWDALKDTVKTDKKSAVKGSATLHCLYGGVIEIMNAGQPEE